MINKFPDELLLIALSFIESAVDLEHAAQVSTLWRRIATEDALWLRLSQNKWKNCRVEIYSSWRHFYTERIKVCPTACNRIVVNSREGNVYTIRPDGTDGRMLTFDASTNKKYRQPTWSPQADRVAFSSASATEGSMIYTCDQLGEKVTGAKTGDPAFYIYWAPDDTRLLFMCNVWGTVRRTFGVFLVDLGKGGTHTQQIELGFPFFFSWSTHPNDPSILAHISRERLEIINVGERSEGLAMNNAQRMHTFEPQSADTGGQVSRCSTPLWLSTTNQAIYAVSGGGRAESYIVCVPLRGQSDSSEYIIAKCLTKSPVRFVSSPSERKLAYSPLEGGLYVCELGRGEDHDHKSISAEVMTAFFWSPNSRYLLWCYLDISRRCFFWAIYDSERDVKYRLASFVPSQDLMNNYFPFFCQYSRSMTLFSPDSNYFVYPDHTGTIFVHGIHEGSAPVAVGEGTYAAWSPL